MSRLLLAALVALGIGSAEPGRFELLGTYKGLGSVVASAVAPGPTPGSQRFYVSYLYVDNTIDVLAVDPDTGAFKVFPNPAPTESGARAMAAGPDGKVYLGTLDGAHFLQLDPKAGKLVDLGRPSSTEEYIWQAAFGTDGKLYGCTYPQARLVRYDPATGALEDLGRMDPVEQYARYLAAGDDGFIYIGTGTSKANIAVYEIATGRHRQILPAKYQTVGLGYLWRGQDGKIYSLIKGQHFRVKGWEITPIPAGEASPPELNNRLRDGRTVTVSGRKIQVTDPASGRVTDKAFDYKGNVLNIFRVGFGPDDRLYASSILPIHLLRLDPQTRTLPEVGDLGGGEVYSFLAHGRRLLMASYSAFAPLMMYDPARPFDQSGGEKNPKLVNFKGSDSSWRPQAFIKGPDGRIYVGSESGYGKLGGSLTVWDTGSGAIADYPHVVTDQSVVSLAVWKNLIVGGTTIRGGGGSFPTQKEAKVFLWDPKTNRKVFETVPVANAGSITDLISAPNGLVYGFAGHTLFVFDPQARRVTATRAADFNRPVYNSVALGPDRRIWGLARSGIFAIDTKTNEVSLVAKAPKNITGGFATKDDSLYFVCGAEVWRYVMSGQ